MLPDFVAGVLQGEDRMNILEQIAVCTPSVTDLRFYDLDDVDVINVHFIIERDANGEIISMEVVRARGVF